MTDNIVPLIYTSKGNLPISTLKYEHEWHFDPNYIKFVERYRDESGEVVKESAHVYSLKPLLSTGELGNLGG